ncbi:TonB-dependent receptor domain-containing protein [Lusitaniella coriacea]|uniref:TonB-dependent receptor domain-containing protein n=1 Tax=Lusitaniella coriacea TaxID=1983105 RepID=UPI003CE997D8
MMKLSGKRTFQMALGVGMLPFFAALPTGAIEEPITINSQKLAQSDPNPQQINRIQVQGIDGTLEIRLDTLTGEGLQPQIRQESDRLIIEIQNAILTLEEEREILALDPLTGIRSVSAIQVEENRVEIVIIGDRGVPTIDIFPQSNGTILQVQPPPEAFADNEAVEDIVITVTRTAQVVENIPRSVTVIDREQIETQSKLTRDVRAILGNLVPGFGPPPSDSTPRSIIQNLRGRPAAILVDGVPLTSNYGLERELRTIDPDIVERIEVLRGPTAIYGAQGTGGVINIITRRSENQPLTVTAEAGLNFSLTHPSESVGNRLGVTVSGQEEQFDYLLSVRREDNGSVFDAKGDRIPETSGGGILDAEAYNFLAKAGVNFDDSQRLQFTFNFYDARQDTNFISDPIVNRIPGIQKARPLAINSETENTDLAGDQNLVVNLAYTHEDIFGSEAQAQLYYREYTAIVGASDFRGGFFDTIARQRAMGDKWGGRVQINTPVPLPGDSANVLWGLDYVREDNEAPFEIFDFDAFDADNTLRKVGERTFVPRHTVSQLGLFAQLEWNINELWLLNGGLRHERIGLDVDDYTTFFGDEIQGGNLNFNATVFNISSVYNATDQISFFGSFAQGFSVPGFGGILRNPPASFTQVEQDLELTEPIKVNNYEIGIRGNWDNIQASLAGFYNTSDLGEFFAFDGDVSRLLRAPSRIYGIEATVDAQLNSAWQLGGTLSWAEGENDDDGDGDFSPISTFSIQPLKLTAYVAHQTSPGWTNRLQFLYVGGRDRAFDAGVDRVSIEDYFVVDLISEVQIGRGSLQIGIQNLLNNQYSLVQSQFLSGFNEIFNAAASGTTVKIGYSIEF